MATMFQTTSGSCINLKAVTLVAKVIPDANGERHGFQIWLPSGDYHSVWADSKALAEKERAQIIYEINALG